MIQSEVSVIKKLSHPNIICLKEFYESERDIYLVTDLAKGKIKKKQMIYNKLNIRVEVKIIRKIN